MLTFDRYLFRSFAHVFCVCFIATFGLVVVIDLLENIDDFLAKNGDRGHAQLVQTIVQYYAYQSLFFLDRAGPTLAVIGVMVVLILFQRSGELHPLLAAGVPMYRVLRPLIVATVCVTGFLVLNQELVIPRIAHAAFESRGGSAGSDLHVEPVYDYATRISIYGRRLRLSERIIEQAEFVLPAPGITSDLTTLKAKQAVQCAATADRPAGWLLKGASPSWSALNLTEQGRDVVLPLPAADELFVVTAVSCDQLYKRNSSYTLLSTAELIERIHSPAFGLVSAHQLSVHLHARFMQPALTLIAVLLVLPLMVRRESPGLVVDSAVCAAVLAVNFGVAQGCQFLGQARVAPPDLAAWAPVVFGGTLAAWLSGRIRT